MRPTCWQQLQELVNAALELSAAERPEFLISACGNDRELQRQVEELIQAFEQTGSYLEKAVAGYADKALAGSSIVGQQIGAYQLTDLLGEGGMGSVYRAIRADDHFRQMVAVKVMRSGFGTTDELAVRFRAERQILANLNHPNIARLLDGGISAERVPYLVMEYIDGQTIDGYVTDNRLSLNDRLGLFRQVCAAIQYAHQNLVVHRDIKPANVLVTKNGIPKLLDFGIAKLLNPDAFAQTIAWTRPAERLMTPEYASPEQIRGETITTATDVYGLGTLLYELLTGRRPFHIDKLTPAGIERVICESSPQRPSTAVATAPEGRHGVADTVPPELDNVVFKAMHKEPARRYASAAALAEDVCRYLEGFPIAARGDSWTYRTKKFVLRHKIATLAAALFVVSTTTLSVGLAVQAKRASDQAVRARSEAETANEVAKFLGSLFESANPDQTQGRSTSARDLLDRGAARIPKELSRHPVVEARLLQALASTYINLGVIDKAESLLNHSYELQRKSLGYDSEQTAESLGNLGFLANARGDYDLALKRYEKALPIYIKIKGYNSPEVALIIGNIGESRWEMGDLPAAEQSIRESIAIGNKIGGPSDAAVMVGEDNLGLILADEGHYPEAEAIDREVLATRLRVLGPNHPRIGYSMGHLVRMLERTSRFAQAEILARQALALRRRLYGAEQHLEIADSLQLLGALARDQGRFEEAQKLGEEALNMATKLLGPNSYYTLSATDDLGFTMLAKGELGRARTLMDASLLKRQKLHTPRHLLALSYDRVGLLDLALRNLPAARENVMHGLQIRQSFYGQDNDNVAISLNHLGLVLAAEGDYAGAEQDFREALRIDRATFHGAHTDTAEDLFDLGTVLIKQRRFREARPPLLESLAMRHKLLPPGHPDIAKSEAALRQITDE